MIYRFISKPWDINRKLANSPKWEDDESGDDEDDSKYDEYVVARFSPSGVVKHFGRLLGQTEMGHMSEYCTKAQLGGSVTHLH